MKDYKHMGISPRYKMMENIIKGMRVVSIVLLVCLVEAMMYFNF